MLYPATATEKMIPAAAARIKKRIKESAFVTALTQLHPVVVPQSSHTMQCPLTFMRIELQLLH